jgi:Fic family protein
MDKSHPLYSLTPSQWSYNDGKQLIKDFLELEARISTLEAQLGFRNQQYVLKTTQSPTVSEFMELSQHEYTIDEVASATQVSHMGAVRSLRRLMSEGLVVERTDDKTGLLYYSFKRDEG